MNRFLPAIALTIAASLFASAAEPVTALAYDAKGELLVAGGRGAVTVIDAKTNEVLGELAGQTGRVTGLAFNPAGILAVASGEAGKSGVVQLFDLSKSSLIPTKPLVEFQAHKDTIYAVAFSPDGKTLATAGYDRLIHLWDVPASTKPIPRLTLTDHSDAIYSLSFHPTGKLLASGSADRSVKVWDAATGKRLYTLSDPIDWVYAVAWSPSGKQLAAAGADKSLRTWDADAAGGKLTGAAFAHEKTVNRLLYAPKGDRIVTVGEDRALKVWDPAKLKELVAIPKQTETVLAAAVRPDGLQLAVGRYDGVVQLVDLATGKTLATALPAKPKPAVLTSISPNFGVRGECVRVVLKGTRLNGITSIASSSKNVIARIRPQKRTATELEFDLTIPETEAPGPIALTATSNGVDSMPLPFTVDRFAAIDERGTTDSARTGMTVALPATIVGTLDRAGDTDYFRFAAIAGQELGVHLQTTLKDGTKFDPVLQLTDDSGQVVAQAFNGSLGFKVAKAGQYAIALRDREYRGGAGFGYRLHVGPVPVVTGVFPIGVPQSAVTEVRVRGVNLGILNAKPIRVHADEKSKIGMAIDVPILREDGDPVGKAEVQVSEFASTLASPEGTATLAAIPGTADGILATAGASHRIAFAAKKGQPLIVETHAARLGSPVDSALEVLDSAGKPVPRAVLRSVAQTNVTFRDHTSEVPGIRLDAWNEFAIDDFLYVGGEILRINALPKGPDDDCKFYEFAGKRMGFLDSTPTYHAMNSPMYKIEFHPPGSLFPPNGLPTFTQFYRNDDGGPGYGKDSRVMFDPPADGNYVAVIRDANGDGGPNHAYRLTVRPPKPSFTIKTDPASPKAWTGGSVPVAITASRIDGFDGPISVSFFGLPKGYRMPSTVIEAGQHTAVVSLTADADSAMVGQATIGTGTTMSDGSMKGRNTPLNVSRQTGTGDIITTTSVPEVAIRPGSETRLVVKIVRATGFAGRVPVEVRGLPHGVRVMNIGLNGILITPNVTEREIVLYAEPWVKPMDHPIVVLARHEGKKTEHAAPSVLLKVQR